MTILKNLLFILAFLMSFNLIYCQDGFSEHSLQFFKNDSEKRIKDSEIWIVLNGKEIIGQKFGSSYRFPKMDVDETFQFIVKTNGVEFRTGTFNSWYLNNGSSIIVGKLTKIEKLLSVAEYNGINKNDEGFDVFSKRFFIVHDVYTIDVENYEEIRRLDYLIVNPNQEGDGSYSLTQRVIKLKNKKDT